MTEKWHGGKGSKFRTVNQEKFSSNWEKIFNKQTEPSEKRKNKK